MTGEHLGHDYMSPEPVGSTHLRFDDARVIKEVCMWLPNVVRSPGSHPGLRTTFGNHVHAFPITLASSNLKRVDPTGSGTMQT